MFRFRLAPNSPLPLFAQVVEQVRTGIARGTLEPGDRLPTVRELAGELLVNPNTVAKAYQELERTGAITTRRGAGTFVAIGGPDLTAAQKGKTVGAKIEASLTEAVHVGMARKTVIQLFMDRVKKFVWSQGGGR